MGKVLSLRTRRESILKRKVKKRKKKGPPSFIMVAALLRLDENEKAERKKGKEEVGHGFSGTVKKYTKQKGIPPTTFSSFLLF
jgi:hypothetical protein